MNTSVSASVSVSGIFPVTFLVHRNDVSVLPGPWEDTLVKRKLTKDLQRNRQFSCTLVNDAGTQPVRPTCLMFADARQKHFDFSRWDIKAIQCGKWKRRWVR